MKKATLIVFAALLLCAAPAFADNIQLVSGDKIQQIYNQPCVIGDPSCNNPQTTWKAFIDFEATPGDFNVLNAKGQRIGYDFFSPVYQIGSELASPNILPTNFNILIDLNTTGATPEYMVFFKSYLCSGVPGSNVGGTSASSTCLPINVDLSNSYISPNGSSGTAMYSLNNPGNGYSDTALTGFTFQQGQYVQFEARVLTSGAGMDQYFVQPAAVPEPGAILLLGTGLVGIAGAARRRLTS